VKSGINIIRFRYTSGFIYSQYSLTKRISTSQILIGDIMTNYTQNCSGSIAASHVGIADSLAQVVRHWMQEQRLKASIQRERASLLSMSDAMLKDIGVDRADAEEEARRSDIPAHR
jgi:uncharacterized protein YjiS (DUF1127 family)